ncbi:coiled-coil-helix-coiled-coil-helix domain-containing protein 1 [Colossoma macropomum]|uniref:coiled-coil-helix-coiled-coil-helix domain-containing protein 1 n=1 Tax=Colossoma macropomum TaxID=42526 RepID=UPI0018652A8B|nr:coiled-coil-helix-coiled-coil-helix domain-containing protein 1 [Colossoma macropomum]
MAVQGAGVETALRRLLSRERGRPVLKPNKPLRLKDEVANRRPEKGEATCITEMSILMACWKQNDFNNTVCSNEVSAFYRCIEKAQAEREKAKRQALGQGGRLLPKQANKLLKRYPNLRQEI